MGNWRGHVPDEAWLEPTEITALAPKVRTALVVGEATGGIEAFAAVAAEQARNGNDAAEERASGPHLVEALLPDDPVG